MNQQAMRFFITGRVQGVGFRKWVKITCENLFLQGNVKNTDEAFNIRTKVRIKSLP